MIPMIFDFIYEDLLIYFNHGIHTIIIIIDSFCIEICANVYVFFLWTLTFYMELSVWLNS